MKKSFTYYPHNTIYGTEAKELDDSAYNEYSIVLRTSTNDEFYALTYSDNLGSSLINGIIYTGTHLNLNPNSSESVYLIKMSNDFDMSTWGSNPDAKFSDYLADPATDPDPTTGNFICLSQDQLRKMLTDPASVDASELSLVRITSDTNATINLTAPYSVSKEVKNQTEAVTGYQYSANVQEEWGEGTEITIAGILRPKEGVSFGSLSRGVYYTKEFQNCFNSSTNTRP